MCCINYNFRMSFDSEEVSIQEKTEINQIFVLHSLPKQFVYKCLYIPSKDSTLYICRKELYLFSHSTSSLFIYNLKKFLIRNNLVKFSDFNEENEILTIVANLLGKNEGIELVILQFGILQRNSEKNYEISPLSMFPIHPSIVSNSNKLIDIQYF